MTKVTHCCVHFLYVQRFISWNDLAFEW